MCSSDLKVQQHFFEGYNPYQKHFPKKTKELIKILLSDLTLENDSLSYNDSLILKVDEAIVRQEDPQIFMITHILHISALIGEVFLAQSRDAEWYMENDGNGETWMPMIKVNRGNNDSGTISFVQWLYEDMMHYAGVAGVVESSYLSLKDFNNLNLLSPEKN